MTIPENRTVTPAKIIGTTSKISVDISILGVVFCMAVFFLFLVCQVFLETCPAIGAYGEEKVEAPSLSKPNRPGHGFATADFGTIFIFHPTMKDFDPSVGAFFRKSPGSAAGPERKALLERRRKDLSEALARHRKFCETLQKQRNGLKSLEEGARKTLEKDLLEARRIHGLEIQGKEPFGPVLDVGSGEARQRKGSAGSTKKGVGVDIAMGTEPSAESFTPDPEVDEKAAGNHSARVRGANEKFAASRARLRADQARIDEEERRSRWDMLSVVYTGPEETARIFGEIREEILDVVEEVRAGGGHLVVFNTTPSYQEGFMDVKSGTSLEKSGVFFEAFEKKASAWLKEGFLKDIGRAIPESGSEDGGEAGAKGLDAPGENIYARFLEEKITDPGIHGPTVEIGTMLWNWFYGLSDARHLVAGRTGTGAILAGGRDITADVLERLLARYRIPREKRELVIKSLDALP